MFDAKIPMHGVIERKGLLTSSTYVHIVIPLGIAAIRDEGSVKGLIKAAVERNLIVRKITVILILWLLAFDYRSSLGVEIEESDISRAERRCSFLARCLIILGIRLLGLA